MWLFTKSQETYGENKKTQLDDCISSYAFDVEDAIRVEGAYGTNWKFSNVTYGKNNEEATIIRAYCCSQLPSMTESAVLATLKRMKTLRHPNLLNWLAGTDLSQPYKNISNVFAVTERVESLKAYVREKADVGNFNLMTSWGIFQIARALKFLNENCKLSHNAVGLDAVFVNKSGEWKLGKLDFVHDVNQKPPGLADNPSLGCPDVRFVDSFGLGCLIWEIFNTTTLRSNAQLQSTEQLPRELLKDYRRLSSLKPAQRCSIASFIKSASTTNGFFSNEYINTLLFLEEIQIKDKEEKAAFMANLEENITSFPDVICRHKILPHLVTGLQFGSAGIEALVPVLKIAPLLSQKDFESIVLPCLVKLFSSPDRVTRVRLLENLPSFILHLPDKVVQQRIFPPVCQGFSDANPFVREATIKAMIHFGPKLSSKLLNDTLPRHLTQLQAKDEEGGIRANATVCLAKLFEHFSKATQTGPLLNAFLRCTRDPFPPGRVASLAALSATQAEYAPKDLAGKVLPCLAFALVDSNKDVREQAFKVVRVVLDRLEKLHESGDLDVKDTQELSSRQSTSSTSNEMLGQFASMAFSMSSKLLSQAMQSSQPKSTPEAVPIKAAAKIPEKKEVLPTAQKKAASPVIVGTRPAPTMIDREETDWDNDANDGWGDDSEDWDMPVKPKEFVMPPTSGGMKLTSKSKHTGDLFDTFGVSDTKPAEKTIPKMSPKRQAKPPAKNEVFDDDANWGDW